MTSDNPPKRLPQPSDERLEVRVQGGLKTAFMSRAGNRQAAGAVIQFIRWYLRQPGATLPRRPPAPEADDA